MQQLIAKLTQNIQFTLEEQAILILFPNYFEQEDLTLLAEFVLKEADSNLLEQLTGADRLTVRFSYQSAYFVLQFEVYSQSCWIEAEDKQSEQQLEQLYKLFVVDD